MNRRRGGGVPEFGVPEFRVPSSEFGVRNINTGSIQVSEVFFLNPSKEISGKVAIFSHKSCSRNFSREEFRIRNSEFRIPEFGIPNSTYKVT